VARILDSLLDPLSTFQIPFRTRRQPWRRRFGRFQTPASPLQEKGSSCSAQRTRRANIETASRSLQSWVSQYTGHVHHLCLGWPQRLVRPNHSTKPNVWSGISSYLPNTMPTDNLTHHARLCKDAAKNWKRPDILDLLSVRHVAADGTVRLDVATVCPASLEGGEPCIRKQWRECSAPVESSLPVRLSLLPALADAIRQC
jgi:hypothetical protein